MTRGVSLLVFSIATATPPTMVWAQTPAGNLRCTVGRGATVIGAYRNLDCDYSRDAQSVEVYAGYTGVVSVNPDHGTPQILAFQVMSARPKSFGELEGRYSQSALTTSDEHGAPVVTTVLRGGRDNEVILRPLSGSATIFTIPNSLLGLAPIQLDYRGEKSVDQRSQADD